MLHKIPSLLVLSLLTVSLPAHAAQPVLPLQNRKPIANFSLNEDDTTRYLNHYLYEQAYQAIEDMLTDRVPVNFAEASFIVENCFYDGELSHADYVSELARICNGILEIASSPAITAPTRDVALNYAIYLFYTTPCPLNHQHPYQYDTNSLFFDGGYASGTVHHLLTTGQGTCRSLPYLYKIIADQIGAHAYLANAPMHTYIRHQDASGRWWNFETTTGTYSRSSFIMENYHVSEEAIKSGLYMTNLSDKESVVQLLYDLLCFYERKTGFYSNSFVRKCYTLGLRYHYADNLHRWKINDVKYQMDKESWLLGLRTEEAIRNDSVFAPRYNQLMQMREEFRRLGYHDFTKEEYIQKYREALDYMQRHNIPIPSQEK